MQVDEVPQRMLSLWTPSKGAGELDMCYVVEESATLKACVLTLNRTLGGGGGPSEIAQFIAELPACSTAPQIGITSFKGITAAMLNPPDDGGKSKDRKKPEEIKQVRAVGLAGFSQVFGSLASVVGPERFAGDRFRASPISWIWWWKRFGVETLSLPRTTLRHTTQHSSTPVSLLSPV
jgi:hypothetical protein